MKLEKIKELVNSMTKRDCEDFLAKVEVQVPVHRLMGWRLDAEALDRAMVLVNERLTYLYMYPELKQYPPKTTFRQRTDSLNGECITRKVSPEEMEKLWQ